MTNSVLVTGLGAITPVGGDAKSTWAALLAGTCGIGPLADPWAAELPVRIGARSAIEPADLLGRVEARRLDRSGQFAILAAREAWADAGFVGPAEEQGTPRAERVAVVFGCGMGGLSSLLDNHATMLSRGGRHVSPHAVPMIMPNGPAGRIGIEIAARAGVHAPTSACATGAEAIAQAADLIRLGRADVVLCGGTEAVINPLAINAFANMRALSRRNDQPERACRPYDRNRDGFVMGEGAGVLILEAAEHAAARGAQVYAEMLGAGISSDAHHIAAPSADGAGLARALRLLLADARLRPDEVGCVNAHATSTPQGDLAESRALRWALGPSGYCVSATKSMTGHLMGAAGAVSALTAVLTIRDRIAPPTIGIDELDPEIDLDVIRDEPRPLGGGPFGGGPFGGGPFGGGPFGGGPFGGGSFGRGRLVVVTSSSGFGGHNVALAFGTTR
jgi:3-oxoacyl-[acyl-carrier-protein] synthase II